MITDKQFSDWAQSSTKYPVLLVEMTHKTGKVYLSDHVYFTNASDTPAHISYDVCLNQTVVVERTLDQDSVGALRVYNDGSLDDWLDYLWAGYEIEIFIGDKSWERADFRRQFKGVIESFSQLTSTSYEIKSTLATSVVQSNISYSGSRWIAGDHVDTQTAYLGTYFGGKVHHVGHASYYDRNDLTITYNNNPWTFIWINGGAYNGQIMLDGFVAGQETGTVRFSCVTTLRKFKELFSLICAHVNQPFNAANLAAYPIDPDITFFDSGSMTFPEFLTVTLDTLGALLWVNDAGEIEFYRKELPVTVDDNTVTSWITPNDQPVIKAITIEDPAASVRASNPNSDHFSGGSPYHYEYNALDLTYPYRTVLTQSYANDSDTIIETRRLADLLAVTRRTYSITINRISPELFIGAIVNVYSPKDRWETNGVGLNALVVGVTQSYKNNTSELIVWR